MYVQLAHCNALSYGGVGPHVTLDFRFFRMGIVKLHSRGAPWTCAYAMPIGSGGQMLRYVIPRPVACEAFGF